MEGNGKPCNLGEHKKQTSTGENRIGMATCVSTRGTATAGVPPLCYFVHYNCGCLPTLYTLGYVLPLVPCYVCIPTNDRTVCGGGKGQKAPVLLCVRGSSDVNISERRERDESESLDAAGRCGTEGQGRLFFHLKRVSH